MSQQNLWTASEIKTLSGLIGKLKISEIAAKIGRSESAIRHKISNLSIQPSVDSTSIEDTIIARLKDRPVKVLELAQEFETTTKEIENVIFEISKTKNVSISNGVVRLEKPPFGHIDMSIYNGGWQKYGLVADTHLCCKEERLDALHAVYDIFEKEGITDVFHAGNIVDGYIPKINGASAIVTTQDGQAQYVVDNYPQRKGITTHYITGDDHEGWWIKEGINWGAYLEMVAKKQGRNDLHYLGHVEADVDFVTKGGKAVMKVQHPGGGSSYARSYIAQKQVESFQGGEKPNILVQGHYHINNYMLERNVHVVNLPGFQDQTVFARKLRLRMEVGGGIMTFKQNPDDGSIARFNYELIPFFDRKYYQIYLRSDKKLVEGKLVINNG